MYFDVFHSPIGKLTIVCNNQGLTNIFFGENTKDYIKKGDHHFLLETKKQLDLYFGKNLKEFNIPLVIQGTPFQKLVWNSLKKIPYGQKMTYGELAKLIGNPKAVRAVGGANNRNPIPIIIPCHRVIGKDGSLVGYAGGLEIKKYLLTLEENN
ncbi:methylated-DNA-[protein]-cysteine S-methyltransferase [Anaerobranca californiensis DSM 14826]|jgi:methylated-DNA-[protein]-cysteine S-methyltransferase|uniref:Methylated-DNA--protein-cysteine methyltransferase n=1 Tax=Anaerobranca californiensis DSM 14826 TaxID=1120989 RepID=A0A1M6MM62_9FIRM|nr:methylated-DNA--[protein]-cysteine S-methyltransferase [Anaerobranca californiensis]SHJ84504.1 methylated-DNA-[protein]-cysteine S-methyltransferase [Anaerobranca californiensis DSM 14826]